MSHEIFDDIIEKYASRITENAINDHKLTKKLVLELDNELADNDYELPLPLPFISDYLIANFHQIDEINTKENDFDHLSNDAKNACVKLYSDGVKFIVKHWAVSTIEPDGWEKYIRPKLTLMYYNLPDLKPGLAGPTQGASATPFVRCCHGKNIPASFT